VSMVLHPSHDTVTSDGPFLPPRSSSINYNCKPWHLTSFCHSDQESDQIQPDLPDRRARGQRATRDMEHGTRAQNPVRGGFDIRPGYEYHPAWSACAMYVPCQIQQPDSELDRPTPHRPQCEVPHLRDPTQRV
jgi:hypothetical protein